MMLRGWVDKHAILLLALALFTIVVLLVLSSPAEAHKPVVAGGHNSGFSRAPEIPDPDVSWAVYGYL